jgi:hypothetical protein
MVRKNSMIWLAACPVAVWVLIGVLGKPLAHGLAARFGERFLRMADGKFTNPEKFIQLRLGEFALLLTVACVLRLAHVAATSMINRRLPSRAWWITRALSGFICLNLFAATAAQTALFWCVLFTGKGHTHNYTQFQIKRCLMREVEAPRQAVLLGSSQTRAEIDERILNERLGKELWTTELHFPGSHPYDLILALEAFPTVKVDYIICYLSEGYFYNGVDSQGLRFFFGLGDFAEFHNLGGRNAMTGGSLPYGLVGDVLPLFRMGEPLAGRVLGPTIQSFGQRHYDESLSTDLTERAKMAASGFHRGPESEFQKKAFSAFARKCQEHHCKLIVCCGQLNPILETALDPALRKDMLGFLRGEATHDPNIVLLDESDLPKQTEGDYDDLTHVNETCQARFTEYVAGVMKKLMHQEQQAGKVG